MNDRKICIVAHNLRSCHNVGSLLRTAEGIGAKVWLTGYTPYPKVGDDQRLPHISEKITKQIQKTALGAEITAHWQFDENIETVLQNLTHENYTIHALELTQDAVPLHEYRPGLYEAIVVGREAEGLEEEILSMLPHRLVIPMQGKKESFNVVQASAMALYHLRFL